MTPRDRIMWLMVLGLVLGYFAGSCYNGADAVSGQQAIQIPGTSYLTTNSPPLSLDAPERGDWELSVTVGQTEFGIPRAQLKQWVLAHPQWKVNPR